MVEEVSGASVPDQALVASDRAAARLAPVGFDPSRADAYAIRNTMAAKGYEFAAHGFVDRWSGYDRGQRENLKRVWLAA